MIGHPSPRTLERFSVGDLAGEAQHDAAAHVERCSSCRNFLEELEAAREARLAAVPSERFIASVVERRDRAAVLVRRRFRRLVLGGATLAAAAAMLVLILPPSPDIRLKGAGIALHRNRAGDVRVLASGDTIRAGDAMRIVLSLAQPAPVAAWFVDANGRLDNLLPAGPISLVAGEHPLPGSAIVEAPCSDLQVVVAVGREATKNTETALRKAVAARARNVADWLPRGAIMRSLRCER